MNRRRTARLHARSGLRGLERAASLIASVIAAVWFGRKWKKGRHAPITQKSPGIETADERTIRRIAEAQAGGISSQESDARYERGENPGGLHHKAHRLPPDAEQFEDEEPPDRLEPHRHARRAMASSRR